MYDFCQQLGMIKNEINFFSILWTTMTNSQRKFSIGVGSSVQYHLIKVNTKYFVDPKRKRYASKSALLKMWAGGKIIKGLILSEGILLAM